MSQKLRIEQKKIREYENPIQNIAKLLNLLVRGGLCPPMEAPSSGPGSFWIEFYYPIGYQVSLVSVSESGSQNLYPRN